jgi:hypothetical protein
VNNGFRGKTPSYGQITRVLDPENAGENTKKGLFQRNRIMDSAEKPPGFLQILLVFYVGVW